MSRFKFPPSIRSRPVYGTLELRRGPAHLLIADAEGAEAQAALRNLKHNQGQGK